MKIVFKVFLFCFTLCGITSSYAQEQEDTLTEFQQEEPEQKIESPISIEHYDVQLLYNVSKKQLDIKVEMDLIRNNTETTAFAMILNGTSIIKHVTCDKSQMQFSQNPTNSTVSFYIPSEFSKQRKNRIVLDYFLPLSSELLQNNILFLNSDNYWVPLLLTNNALLKLTITTPKGYDVMAQGAGNSTKKENGDKYIFHFQQAATDMSFPIMIGKETDKNAIIRQIGDEENPTSICFNFIAIDSLIAPKIADEVVRTFEFYQWFLGKYTHHQLNFVEVPGKDAKPKIQGNNILFTKAFIQEFEEGKTNFQDVTAAQWWGNGIRISSDSKLFPFLFHSIKEFFTLYNNFKDKDHEEFVAEIEKYKTDFEAERDAIEEKAIIDIVSLSNERDKAVIHLKGVVVVYYLTNLLGDDVWKDFFREIYQLYNGKTFTYDNFMEVVKSYDNANGDISTQLNNWLSTTGLPTLPVAVDTTEEPDTENTDEVDTENEDKEEMYEIKIHKEDTEEVNTDKENSEDTNSPEITE